VQRGFSEIVIFALLFPVSLTQFHSSKFEDLKKRRSYIFTQKGIY